MVIKNLSKQLVSVKLACDLCGNIEEPLEKNRIRSNIRKYRDHLFEVWRCRNCASIHCELMPEYSAFYADYTLRQQKAGYFLNTWYANILRRLKKAGLKHHHAILDYGCNSGLFLDYIKKKGFKNVSYYDPFVEQFRDKTPLAKKYDFVVCFDVIEHDLEPKKLFQKLSNFLNKNGFLCIETPNANGIDLKNSEEFIHALHLPYHINLLSAEALMNMGNQNDLVVIKKYEDWYMNSWLPGTSRRFFERFMKLGGNDMETAFEKPNIKRILLQPKMIFDFFFGYFLKQKKKDHMMIIFKK